MIDRHRRHQMAQLLRWFCAGLLSNDEFDSAMAQVFQTHSEHEDRGLMAVRDAGWSLYSDLREYKLRGKFALTDDGRREVARWIMFLYSDYEYEWRRSVMPSVFLTLLTVGLWCKYQTWRMRSEGDLRVWPFIRNSDYEEALRSPRLLAGK